ncbi:MAG TPA: xanthine dehydrogenase [Rhodospirillaceae bacterium]|nr:xanthine dehydrogenase [Rhodospirillaceae bacterium]HAA93800.1 xanthine dehydrogenase [Rhodospirillaceae bacterium]HAT35435.1 xanthine dehydrogenase [Rhodospirillaceae bacterium]|tara:strand:- start:341 stop:676 length:336 start_codon:yes stop_codon:yes gene_type:complete
MIESDLNQESDILNQAAEWLGSGRQVALATVVNTWGSSPRPVGSQLAVTDEQAFIGSVSGGCIEGAVIETAMKVMDDGKPQLLEFSVSNEMAWEVGLACGGTVEVFVERLA